MITRIGVRAPRLFFVTGEGDPYYFKEDLVLPEITFEKPTIPPGAPIDEQYRLLAMTYCARMSEMIAVGGRLSDRIIATSRLAKLLGIDDFVAQAERAEIEYRGEQISGTRMPAFGGAIFSDIRDFTPLAGYRVGYSPKAVRQLTILVMFDFICGQIDRHSKNIKLFLDIDLGNVPPPKPGADLITVERICAIDHDLSFGEVSYDHLKQKVCAGMCISPELCGELHYPAVDLPFYERLISISREEYRDVLGDLLSENELSAFFDRLAGVKRIVEHEKLRSFGHSPQDDTSNSGILNESEPCHSERSEESSFPRLLTDDAMYAEYLRLMEEHSHTGGSGRFSYRPTYLKDIFLRHDVLGEHS